MTRILAAFMLWFVRTHTVMDVPTRAQAERLAAEWLRSIEE